MTKVKDMTKDELEQFVENKIVEVFGDPDHGLQVKEEFIRKLEKRLKSKTKKRIPHKEVLKNIG